MHRGITSASLIVVILVAAAVGAIVGAIIGESLNGVALAVIAGFLATIASIVVRNKLLNRTSGVGPDDFRIPMVVIVFALVGSLAGSLAGKELVEDVVGAGWPVWTGTVAGIVSAILTSLLMITYYMNPAKAGK